MRTFTPEGDQVYVSVHFAGAPPGPDPASIYTGGQLILVRADGTTFPNGDGWRCVTCGVPAANKIGINDPDDNTYPEAFYDGRRVKMGSNVLDCSPYRITDPECSPENTHIYPIKSPFPAFPAGGIMREIRLHPDNVHLGWNQLFFSRDFTAASEFGVFGRLTFNPTPDVGAPGYELSQVWWMLSPELGKSGRFIRLGRAGELVFDKPQGVIGEFRGFTSDGRSALGIGAQHSFNYDIFTTDLRTGKSVRQTFDPAYTDPAVVSPDGRSMVIMDGRVTEDTGYPGANPAGTDGRMYFASAGPVPPLIDLAIAEAVGGLYTSPDRLSFFQPYLIDLQAEGYQRRRDIHDGHPLNTGGDPTAGSGSISDPLWVGGADPAWSPDSTAVVYYQRQGCNSGSSCPESMEPGGRQARLMIARLIDRKPRRSKVRRQLVHDEIPWGIPYEPGDSLPPERPTVPAGAYLLRCEHGWADVQITDGPSRFNSEHREVAAVTVTYHHCSVDGLTFVDGTEEGIREEAPTRLVWHADLTFSGLHSGTRKSSKGGFVVRPPAGLGGANFEGSLTTTLDGLTFESPQ